MKYRFAVIAAVFAASAVSCSASQADQEKLSRYIRARGFYVVDAESGKFIAGKNPYTSVPVASTTKMVTALTALSRVQGNPIITITKEAAAVGGARAEIRAGEQYRFSDLLSAMLVRSANDAAVAIAIASSGSRSAFIKDMNAWCKAHALTHSHFEDPAGLSPQSVSSPEELVKITKEFLAAPQLEAIASLNTFTLTSLKGRETKLMSLNTLRRVMPEDVLSIKGKTGFTKKAKYCFAGRAVTPNGKWFISVTGSDSSWREVYMLVKYCNGELELK